MKITVKLDRRAKEAKSKWVARRPWFVEINGAPLKVRGRTVPRRFATRASAERIANLCIEAEESNSERANADEMQAYLAAVAGDHRMTKVV